MPEEQWRTKWKQVRELGDGGQGTTYEVVSLTEEGQRGVVKLLLDYSDPQAGRRMAHEAINLQGLAKEKVTVPRLLDHNTHMYGDAAVQLYLVMEFISGETLDRAVSGRGGSSTGESATDCRLDGLRTNLTDTAGLPDCGSSGNGNGWRVAGA